MRTKACLFHINKNTTHAKKKIQHIANNKQKQNKVIIRNVPKIGVQKTKNN